MKKTFQPLPEKLSDLILLGLKDLGRVERMKGYKVDMTQWHQPNGQCRVCFAGAVMVCETPVKRTDDALPNGYYDETGAFHRFSAYESARFRALDWVRKGRFANAHFALFGTTFPIDPELFPGILQYSLHPKRFKLALRTSVKILKSHGL